MSPATIAGRKPGLKSSIITANKPCCGNASVVINVWPAWLLRRPFPQFPHQYRRLRNCSLLNLLPCSPVPCRRPLPLLPNPTIALLPITLGAVCLSAKLAIHPLLHLSEKTDAHPSRASHIGDTLLEGCGGPLEGEATEEMSDR